MSSTSPRDYAVAIGSVVAVHSSFIIGHDTRSLICRSVMWWQHSFVACLLTAVVVLPCEAAEAPTCSYSPISPAPSNLKCNQQGKVTPGTCIGSSTVASQQLCRDTCLANTACLSFSYAAGTKKCELYKKSVHDSRFTKCNSGLYFWDKGCYRKTCNTCPADTKLCNSGNGAKRCVDTKTDNNNCGRCGNRYSASNVCTNGSCACSAAPISNNPRTNCGGTCVDLSSDENNCGTCSNNCANDETCTATGANLECSSVPGCCYCDGPLVYDVTRAPAARYARTYSGRGQRWPSSNFQAFSEYDFSERRACDALAACATLFTDNSLPHINLYWSKQSNKWRCVHSNKSAGLEANADAGASLVYLPVTN